MSSSPRPEAPSSGATTTAAATSATESTTESTSATTSTTTTERTSATAPTTESTTATATPETDTGTGPATATARGGDPAPAPPGASPDAGATAVETAGATDAAGPAPASGAPAAATAFVQELTTAAGSATATTLAPPDAVTVTEAGPTTPATPSRGPAASTGAATDPTTAGDAAPATPGTVSDPSAAAGMQANGELATHRRDARSVAGASKELDGAPLPRTDAPDGPSTNRRAGAPAPSDGQRAPSTAASNSAAASDTPTTIVGAAVAAAPAPATAAPARNQSAVDGMAGVPAQLPAVSAALDGTDAAQAPSRPAPVVEQVLDAVLPLRTRSDGDYHVKLELRPAELGRVELTVELHDGVLSVHMHADNAAARDVLQHQLARLRDMLQERGVRTGSLDVGDHSDHSGRATSRDRGDGAPSRDATRAVRSVPAAAIPDDRRVAAAPAPARSTSGRLDLHV